MSQNYFSAFARVADGGDGSPSSQATLPQTYHQLAAFSMPHMNATAFPSSSAPSSNNPAPAHSHPASSGQQSSICQVSQAQQWVQNVTTQRPINDNQSRSLPHILPTTNLGVPGTPLLEWNGREWIPPQQSSIAAVAASQQVSLQNATVQNIPATYTTLGQLGGWNTNLPQQQLHDNQQANHNHIQHSQQRQPPSASNSFQGASETGQSPSNKQRKRSSKSKPRQIPSSQLQNQHTQPTQQLSSVQNLSLDRSNSSEDLLSADQLARVSRVGSSAHSKNTILQLAPQQPIEVLHVPQQLILQQQQQSLPEHQRQQLISDRQRQQPISEQQRPLLDRPAGEQTVLTELLPAVASKQDEPPKPATPPRPVRPFDGRFAVCPNCALMSKDYNNCEFCKKVLPDDCKMFDPVKAKDEERQRKKELQLKVQKEKLLIAKLKQEQDKQREANRYSQQNSKLVRTEAGKGTAEKHHTSKATTPTVRSFYGRKVTVKDYSDDDPVWTPSRARSRGGGKALGRRGRKAEAEVYVISSSDDESDEYIPAPTSRSTTKRQEPLQQSSATHSMGRGRGRAGNSGHVLKPDLTHIPELYMKCTKITMGSLQGKPNEPLHIAISGVDISLETETQSVKIRLDNRDVRECLGCTHQNLPVLFFRANESFGVKVRNALGMSDSSQNPYYDPDSTNVQHKYIVGYLDDKAQITNFGWRLQEVFRAISLQYQTGGVLLRFIELHVAENLLAKITGKEGHSSTLSALDELAMSYDDDISHEYNPDLVFEGPVRKMFQYPFPPSVGSEIVTNADYFCLHEGEFLNDVIIRFYLRYLSEEVLSAADRERTYVFSSFFYTKLVRPLTVQASRDTKKSLAEKRHAGVKTWTKNVDIFSKDFLIIPINEHSHWYLAIICFPYLDGIVYAQSNKPSAEDNLVSSTTSEDSQVQQVSGSESGDKVEPPSDVGDKQKTVVTNSSPTSPSTQQAPSAPSQSPVPSQSPAPSQSSTALVTAAEATTSPNLLSATSSETSMLPADLFGFEESEDDEPKTASSHKIIEKRPCILIFDSLAGPGHSSVVKALRDYLAVEWQVRKGTTKSFSSPRVKGSNVKCPQQNNYSDCGVYLLQYVETFFQKPITDWSIPIKATRNWFDYSVIKHKRSDIKALITKLEKEYAARPTPARGRPRTRPLLPTTQSETTATGANLLVLEGGAPSHKVDDSSVGEADNGLEKQKPNKTEESEDDVPAAKKVKPEESNTEVMGCDPALSSAAGTKKLVVQLSKYHDSEREAAEQATVSNTDKVTDGIETVVDSAETVGGAETVVDSAETVVDSAETVGGAETVVDGAETVGDAETVRDGAETMAGKVEKVADGDAKVKEDSSSSELLDITRHFTTSTESHSGTEAMDQSSLAPAAEAMQTESPVKAVTEQDDADMQTDEHE